MLTIASHLADVSTSSETDDIEVKESPKSTAIHAHAVVISDHQLGSHYSTKEQADHHTIAIVAPESPIVGEATTPSREDGNFSSWEAASVGDSIEHLVSGSNEEGSLPREDGSPEAASSLRGANFSEEVGLYSSLEALVTRPS